MASVQKEILADETLTKEEKLAIQKALSSISISDAEKQAMSKQIGTAIDSAVTPVCNEFNPSLKSLAPRFNLFAPLFSVLMFQRVQNLLMD